MESRGSPVSPNASIPHRTGAVLWRKINSVSNNNNTNNSRDVKTQETSQKQTTTVSKLLTDVGMNSNVENSMLRNTTFKSISDNDPTKHGLNDLLTRGTLIGTGTITQDVSEMVFGHLAGADPSTLGLIGAYAFPSSIITKNPVVSSKVKQFSLIKAGINVDIKVACPPTVSGSLLATYIPINYGQSVDFSNLTMQALTSYPCTRLDYSTDTNMSMELPYINEYDYHNMQQATNIDGIAEALPSDYAYVVLWNMVKPNSGTAADKVSFSIMASFNNVELKLPTEDVPLETTYDLRQQNLFSPGFVAQGECKFSGDDTYDCGLVAQGKTKKWNTGGNSYIRKKECRIKKEELFDCGLVAQSETHILDTDNNSGMNNNTGITDRDSRNDSNLVTRMPGRDMMSGDDFNSSVPLSYKMIKHNSSKAKYDKRDELNLNYVLSRENVIGRINYTSGKGPNGASFLGKVRCFPKRPQMAQLVNMPSQMGTFDYTCNLFARYRGSVNIGLEFIKTKFHYGRVLVVVDPNDRIEDKVNANELGSLLSTNYSIMIDLNENDGKEGKSDYYKINVPYLNNTPYTSIGNDTFDAATTGGHITSKVSAGSERAIAVAQERYNPYLRFYAFTELGHTEAVASVVPILVSISAGDDFELSIPTVKVVNSSGPTVAPRGLYCQGEIEIEEEEDKDKMDTERNMKQQMVDLLDKGEKYDDNFIAQSELQFVADGGENDIAAMCVGERITSLEELAKRFTAPRVGHKLVPACLDYTRTNVGGNPSSTVTYADPFPGGVTLSLHTNTPEGFQLSNLEAVANIYRYTFGPRRYKVMANEPSTIMARLIRCPDFTGYANDTTLQLGATSATLSDWTGVYPVSPVASNSTEISGSVITSSEVNNFLEVKRPFYSNTKLVQTRGPKVNPEGVYVGRDTILVNFLAIPHKATKTYKRTLGASVNRVRIEACYLHCVDGGLDIQLATRSDRNTSWGSQKHMNLNYDPELSFQERDYAINTSSAEERALTFSRYSTCHVVEALGEGAGFTFLQGPPCVIFG